jgi:hypothetical protein
MADSAPLTTGWEPHLPRDDSVLRQFLFAHADRLAEMAGALDGRVEGDADARLVDLSSPFMYDNAVVPLRPLTGDRLGVVLARAAAFYPPNRSWVLVSAWPLPDLSARGLTLVGHPPLMLRPPGGAPPPMPPELRISPVTTATDLAVFHRLLIEGSPSPDDAGVIADPRLVGSELHLFVGYAAGTPVATAGAAIHHGLIEIDWVTTLPEARGRGYGTALTWRATRIAPNLPAVLIASDPGQPAYERLGFLRLLRLTLWGRFA